MSLKILTVVGTLAFGICFAATDAVYKNSQYGFSFSYPSDWMAIPDFKIPVIVGFREPKPKGNFVTNMNVVVIPVKGVQKIQKSDLKSLGDSNLKGVAGVISGYRLIKRTETTLGGQPTAAYVYAGKGRNQEDLQWYQIQSVYEERGYTLTFTTSKMKYPSALGIFENIKNNFELL